MDHRWDLEFELNRLRQSDGEFLALLAGLRARSAPTSQAQSWPWFGDSFVRMYQGPVAPKIHRLEYEDDFLSKRKLPAMLVKMSAITLAF